MSWTDSLPEWMQNIFTSAQDAEVAVATEGDVARLQALRERSDKLQRTLDLFAGSEELVADMETELRKIQTTMLLTREVNDLLRLQGQGVALYKLIETPKEAWKELALVQEQLKPLEQMMAARDAAAAGE